MKFLRIITLSLLFTAGVAQAEEATPAAAPAPDATPAPAAATPPATAAPAPKQAAPVPGAFFYYCQKTNAYFPNVRSCDDGWVAVPVGPAAPGAPAAPPEELSDEEYNQQTVADRKNGVHLELFGRANNFSVDYDRALSKHFTIGIGLASWTSTSWWDNYTATVTVVPVYANYYFSQTASRGFVSLGVDWISVSQSGWNDRTFANNGVAGTAGGGWEFRTHQGFVLQLGGFVIVGRSVTVNPTVSVGYSF